MEKFYMGIDPGQSGGIAVISDDGIVHPHKMPVTERDVADIIETWSRLSTQVNSDKWDGASFALIEKVHSFPGQGVASTFKFGRNYGLLRGLLIAYKIPFDEVAPGTWQKALGCLTKGDKNITKTKAQQLFPDVKVTHAIADALLIATYCRRKHGNEDLGREG